MKIRYVYQGYGLGYVVTKDYMPTPIYRSSALGRASGTVLKFLGFRHLGKRMIRGKFVRFADPVEDMQRLRETTRRTMERNIAETLFK